MWIPTVRMRKTVLEFVAVGELSKASLCSVVKGGGNSHRLGEDKYYSVAFLSKIAYSIR